MKFDIVNHGVFCDTYISERWWVEGEDLAGWMEGGEQVRRVADGG